MFRFESATSDCPIVAAAIHHGHMLRPNLRGWIALNDDDRLREEDPYTGRLALRFDRNIVVETSRFEVDLNRPRGTSVYRGPSDAWGLVVWQQGVPTELFDESVRLHTAFYDELATFLDEVHQAHPRFIVLDIHSYNHRRAGPDAEPADPVGNPEINVGTGSMERAYWAPVVERFMAALSEADDVGFDVRENVKFQGRYFGEWIHNTFPRVACCLSIELKKTFMDEWTGLLHQEHLNRIANGLDQASRIAASALQDL